MFDGFGFGLVLILVFDFDFTLVREFLLVGVAIMVINIDGEKEEIPTNSFDNIVNDNIVGINTIQQYNPTNIISYTILYLLFGKMIPLF